MVFLIAGVAVASGLAILVIFAPAEGAYLLHATRSSEFTLRLGIWLTALCVIIANRLFGAEPYRVLPQITPEAHPHNTFLEFAAMMVLRPWPHTAARMLQSQQRAPWRERAQTNEP